jgi:hypothetical protein
MSSITKHGRVNEEVATRAASRKATENADTLRGQAKIILRYYKHFEKAPGLKDSIDTKAASKIERLVDYMEGDTLRKEINIGMVQQLKGALLAYDRGGYMGFMDEKISQLRAGEKAVAGQIYKMDSILKEQETLMQKVNRRLKSSLPSKMERIKMVRSPQTVMDTINRKILDLEPEQIKKQYLELVTTRIILEELTKVKALLDRKEFGEARLIITHQIDLSENLARNQAAWGA